jgi:hypothetical protein
LKSEGIVRFTVLSRVAIKFLEVAGAGAASALCAYMLGQFERHPAPAPAPAVIPLSPTAAEHRLPDYQTRAADLTAQVQTPPPAVPNAPTIASAAKLPKLAPAALVRRNQKPGQGVRAEKARTGEPPAIQPGTVASSSAGKPATQTVQPATAGDQAGNGGEEERPLVARLTSWFLPENDRIFGELPRPPMPVGDSLRSAM